MSAVLDSAATTGLHDALGRLPALGFPFNASVSRGRGRNWVNADRLFAGRPAHLKKLVKRMRARNPGVDDDVLACKVLAAYSWPIAGTAMSCFLLDCRVPVLELGNLDLRFDRDDRVVALGFRSGAEFALDGEPLWALTEVTAADDLARLRGHLHAALEQHFAPVVQSIRELLPVGPRVAWGNVGDRLIQAAAWIVNQCRGNGGNDSAPAHVLRLDAVREVELLVGRPDSPLFNRRAALTIDPRGRARAERGSCCLRFREPCGRHCANCPVELRRRTRTAALAVRSP